MRKFLFVASWLGVMVSTMPARAQPYAASPYPPPPYASTSRSASSYAKNVGLGFAGGIAYIPSQVQKGNVRQESGTGYSWGFFVDIPLLETFYISPSAILYELDLGTGNHPATDIDLAFKFIAPVGRLHVGGGALVGLTSEELQYDWHLGALAYVSYDVIANIEVFALAQYKRIFRAAQDLDDVHAFAGLMFVL